MEIDSELLDTLLVYFLDEFEGLDSMTNEVALARAIKEEIAKSDKVLLIEIPF